MIQMKTAQSGCNTDSEKHTWGVVSNIPIDMKSYLTWQSEGDPPKSGNI